MIYVGADHAGFELKEKILDFLDKKNIPYLDVGPKELQPGDDYPSIAFKVAKETVSHPNARGLVVCGSGVGASIAANKIPGVRASNIENVTTARRARKEDNLNVLTLGARVLSTHRAKRIVKAWLFTDFTYARRHLRRLQKIRDFEEKYLES